MLLQVCVVLLAGVLWWKWQQGARLREMMGKLRGPKTVPIFGNALQLGTSTVELLKKVEKIVDEFRGQPIRVWGGSIAFIVLTDPKDIEIILGSNKLLDKGKIYNFLHPWLGTGLLTSTGDKWRRNRKILTPTFHFKILEQFIDVFNSNGETLIEKLKEKLDGSSFDIYKYLNLYALDNIAETAMGIKMDAQNSVDSVYVQAIRKQSDIVMMRAIKPWLANDFLFSFTNYKKVQTKCLKILHDFTNGVIKQRKEEITAKKALKKATGEEVVDQSDGVKKRLAFLDLLIESTFEGSLLTDENIREEVDTFMFEGHDTTSSSLGFTLYLLSWNKDIQDQVFQELKEVFPDPEEPVSFRGLQELKVMERVIKESLRLYPSVPVYVRHLTEDVVLSQGHIAPKDATISISAYFTHRNPDVWPDPLKFDPDRFLPENVQGRHPYAFVPFSAGPRNCIGQKFAMLEMKSCLAHVLREYKVLPGKSTPDLVLSPELVLIAHEGVPVRILKRK